MNRDPDCIFCKIAAGEIPCQKIYEDDDLLAFKDIRPAAPVHLLIIPKMHLPSLNEAGEQGADNGFRTVINTGRDGGQEVYHLHLHIMGGPRPWKHG